MPVPSRCFPSVIGPPVSTGGFLGGVCVMRASCPCKPRVETSGPAALLMPYSRTDITTTRQTRRRPIRDPPVSTGGFLGGVCVMRASCPCKPRVETSGQVVPLTPRWQTASSEQRRRHVSRQTPCQRNRDPPVSTGGFSGGVCGTRASCPCKPRVETSGPAALLTLRHHSRDSPSPRQSLVTNPS